LRAFPHGALRTTPNLQWHTRCWISCWAGSMGDRPRRACRATRQHDTAGASIPSKGGNCVAEAGARNAARAFRGRHRASEL
jgi:hypothetical protein